MNAKPLIFAPKMILCPVDTSAASRTVLSWARLFAEAYQAKLKLVHAEWPDYPPYFLLSQEAELEAQAEQRRAAVAEGFAKLAREALGTNVSPEVAVLEGYPAEVILARAASSGADLIVLGSHGRSGMSRLRLGSVAENVVRGAMTPTLIAKAHAEEQPVKISRILCPVDLTKGGHRSLELSAQVAAAFHAQLIVLHAVEYGAFDLSAKQQELCQWVPAEVRSHCELVEVVRHGNAAEQILLTARDRAADLIILEAGRRPFLDLSILGTTTERVIRHADSAVLVVP